MNKIKTAIRSAITAAQLAAGDGAAWGAHAYDADARIQPLQADKLAANTASLKRNGFTGRTLAARVLENGTLEFLEGRHLTAALIQCGLGAAEFSIRIVDCDDLAALSIAAHSNGEGMGYSIAAALEAIGATVRHLAQLWKRNRNAKLFPLVKPRTKLAYSAFVENEKSNPYRSHAKRGSWTVGDYTAEHLAPIVGVSTATVTRLLHILAGLYAVDQHPADVAGMTLEAAALYSNTCLSHAAKTRDGETPQQRAGLTTVRRALIVGKDVLAEDGTVAKTPTALATVSSAGKPVKTQKPVKKTKSGPQQRRRFMERFEAAIAAAAAMLDNLPATPADRPTETEISHAARTVEQLADRLRDSDTFPQIDAEDATDEDDFDPDAPDVELTATQTDELMRLRAS